MRTARAPRKREVEKIDALGVYASVQNAYMEEAPLIANWVSLTTTPNVVVVPFFISDGLHSHQDIPILLGIEAEVTAAASQREIFRHNPHRLHERDLYYASAIGTEPKFSEIIVEQAAAFDRTAPLISRRFRKGCSWNRSRENKLDQAFAAPGGFYSGRAERSQLAEDGGRNGPGGTRLSLDRHLQNRAR